MDDSGPQESRDAAFLRLYARAVREKRERTLEIPSVIATVLEGIADRLDLIADTTPNE